MSAGGAMIVIGIILGVIAFIIVIVLGIWYLVDRNNLKEQGLAWSVNLIGPSNTTISPDGNDIYIVGGGTQGSTSQITINKPNINTTGHIWAISNNGNSGAVQLIPGPGVTLPSNSLWLPPTSTNGSTSGQPTPNVSTYQFVWLDSGTSTNGTLYRISP